MSTEETKIREELEMDVERGLEEEIKDGIYRLALKLHRLYQHQNQKNSNPSSSSSPDLHHDQNNPKKKPKLISEININIKMEGGTTIQINEIKRMAKGSIESSSAYKHAKHVQAATGKTFPRTRRVKFDWENSLRSGSSCPSNVINNNNDIFRSKENVASSSGHGKIDIGKKIAMRELGWKF